MDYRAARSHDYRYFDDDIVKRFVEFVSVVYGEDTLEENLNFIAEALGIMRNISLQTRKVM